VQVQELIEDILEASRGNHNEAESQFMQMDEQIEVLKLMGQTSDEFNEKA